MTPNEYQNNCMKFASKVSQSTSYNLLLQGVMGMSGESGEAIDIVKKITFHGHPFNEEVKSHLAKELGDVLWYVATSARAIGYNLSEIMELNIDKLSKRYPDGHFDTEKSLHRKEGDI